jgi:inward rectifier potassium channel
MVADGNGRTASMDDGPRGTHSPARFSDSPRPGAVERIAFRRIAPRDLYHTLFTIGWPGFFALMGLAYVLFNLAFGLLYLIEAGSIANAKPRSFADAFFFSVQTMATIGYGDMHPATLYANLLVTVEVLLGLAGFALATGLIFARFSRPTARVMFSRVAVVSPYDGVPTLMFRAANQRHNQILAAQVSVALLREEVTADGTRMRRFHDLALARRRTPMFALTWTVMHPVDEQSPLHGATPETLAAQQAEIVVGLTGIDETFAQTIHARHSYRPEEIVWNRRFVDVLGWTADGRRSVDYARFHDIVPIDR